MVRFRNIKGAVLTALLTGLVMMGISSAQAMNPLPNVTLDVFPSQSSVQPGDTFDIVIRQNIRDNWHTYWTNPGDSGEPMAIEWDIPQGVDVGPIIEPTPHRISYDPLINFGHKGQPLFVQSITISPDYEGSSLQLVGQASWLVCDEICIPEYQDISLNIPVNTATKGDVINQALFDEAYRNLPQSTNWQGHIQFDEDAKTIALNIDIPADYHNQMTDVTIFPYDWGIIDPQSDVMADIGDKTVTFTATKGNRDMADIIALGTTDIVLQTNGGDAFIITLDVSPVATQTSSTGTGIGEFIAMALAAILGGLILNLMPCVFPILSMKALSLVQLSETERKQAVKHGMAYSAGVILSFAFVALVLIILKAAGASIGWGFQLQNPYVVVVLIVTLFIIAMNLFGFFEIRGQFAGIGTKLTDGHSPKSSFFTGVLATLVATPCSAPFMASAIGYALTQSAFVALFIFIMLGVGLALPFFILTIIPSTQKLLPKPGAWMETFRQFLGFPMMASAVWLLWVLQQQSGDVAILYGLGLCLIMTLILWLWKRNIGHNVIAGLSVVTLILAVWYAPLLHKTTHINHIVFTQETLNQTLLDNPDRPVFVNMTASWCITCLVNERTSLSASSVKDAMMDRNVIYIKGDWTNQNPEITKYLESFGRNGVPLYIYYDVADKDTGIRPQPIMLPQILTPNIVTNTLYRQTTEGE